MLAFILDTPETFSPVSSAELPIYRQNCAEYVMFYAPNCLCVVNRSDAEWFETTIAPLELCPAPESGQTSEPGENINWGTKLWHHAGRALAEVDNRTKRSFHPESLTLYMNNRCNLRCVYCHTDTAQELIARLDLDVIAAAAEIVAENCREKGIPFYAVFHGGGEPILHRQRVEHALERITEIATKYDVELFRYVATNGIMSGEKAIWLARHFDLVGLSCDGPPDVQNSQRPHWNGDATARIVEHTAHVLHEQGCLYNIRTTITRATLDRQAEIADYICWQFSPQEIIFEPVYLGGRNSADTGLNASHAHLFATQFLMARKIAGTYNIPLTTSGSRLGIIHGPYCNVFRSVLNLTPGGIATACFKTTDAVQTAKKGAVIGAMNDETGRFEIDYLRVQALRRQLTTYLPQCSHCFNRYHCVQECPDFCPLDRHIQSPNLDKPEPNRSRANRLVFWHKRQELSRLGPNMTGPNNIPAQPSFRCRAQKMLTYATLREKAEQLWAEATIDHIRKNGDNTCEGNHCLVYGTTVF
jgi:uncharacterized protein